MTPVVHFNVNYHLLQPFCGHPISWHICFVIGNLPRARSSRLPGPAQVGRRAARAPYSWEVAVDLSLSSFSTSLGSTGLSDDLHAVRHVNPAAGHGGDRIVRRRLPFACCAVRHATARSSISTLGSCPSQLSKHQPGEHRCSPPLFAACPAGSVLPMPAHFACGLLCPEPAEELKSSRLLCSVGVPV